jgi:hypothetical protein
MNSPRRRAMFVLLALLVAGWGNAVAQRELLRQEVVQAINDLAFNATHQLIDSDGKSVSDSSSVT